MAAEAHFDRLHVERAAPDEVPESAVPPGDPVHLPALIAACFGLSRSEARRLVTQGGVRIDGTALADGRLDVPRADLDGVVLQVGKRRFTRLSAAS